MKEYYKQPSPSPETDAIGNEAPSPEIQTNPNLPMIYAASLSDYNAGRLHGVWIDATQDHYHVSLAIAEMLSQSSDPQAAEFAIHDYSGFAGWQPSEQETILTVVTVAQAIAEHGPAVSHWIDYLGALPEQALESFEQSYLGNWRSMEDYAEHLVEDLGVTITVEPEAWGHYIHFDTAALGRDLEIELHSSPTADGSVYLFDVSVVD